MRIDVEMEADVGFFQVEEVLMQKLSMSPAKSCIELYAGVSGQIRKRYL
jgi:metal-dependent HD superfamily phosphatase/phosphodiesterase